MLGANGDRVVEAMHSHRHPPVVMQMRHFAGHADRIALAELHRHCRPPTGHQSIAGRGRASWLSGGCLHRPQSAADAHLPPDGLPPGLPGGRSRSTRPAGATAGPISTNRCHFAATASSGKSERVSFG